MRSGWLAACAVVVLTASGCATEAALEGLDDMGQVGRTTVFYEAQTLLAAYRVTEGEIHLRVRYDDGEERNLVYEPASHPPSSRRRPRRIVDCAPKPSPGHWPAPGARGRVRLNTGSFPKRAYPVAVGDGGGALGAPCLRIRRGHLERSDGKGYVVVGRTPRIKRTERTWVTYLAEGSFATFVVPLAVACDVAVGALYVLAHMR